MYRPPLPWVWHLEGIEGVLLFAPFARVRAKRLISGDTFDAFGEIIDGPA